MKYLLVIADGMGDESYDELGSKTPLEFSRTPTFDKLALNGIVGKVNTIPQGMYCGSLEGNLSILGYDLLKNTVDLAAITANNMEIGFNENDFAIKARFVETEFGVIAHSKFKGFIDWDEYIHICNKHIKNLNGEIYQIKDNDFIFLFKNNAKCNENYSENKENIIIDLCEKINRELEKYDSNMPNRLIFYGGGNRVTLNNFSNKFNVKTVMIAGSYMLECIAKCVNLNFIRPNGATGDDKTDLKSKANVVISAFDHNDFIIVHINATDTISHFGNILEKVNIISRIDQHFLKPIIDSLETCLFRLLILPDHITSCRTRTHQYGSVPFLYYDNSLNSKLPRQLFGESASTQINYDYGYDLLPDFFSTKGIV